VGPDGGAAMSAADRERARARLIEILRARDGEGRRLQGRGGAGGEGGGAGAAEGEGEDDDGDEPPPGASPHGTFSSFVCGAAMGAVFGFLMLLWVGQSSLSRRFRVGIVLGVALNIGFSVLAPAMQKEGDKARRQIGDGAGAEGADGSLPPGAQRLPLGPPAGAEPIGL
jgi:hypothetical protein